MQLDEHQKAAVETRAARVLVSARPGSGKTRTITARVQYMIKKMGILPSQIVLLTFTRYAANEMRSRIGDVGLGMFIGTFHAFALHLIMTHGIVKGWEPDWLTLLDEDEALIDWYNILRDLGLMDHNGKWKGCKKSDFEKFRMQILSGKLVIEETDYLQAKFLTAWQRFLGMITAENVLTFGTLIIEATQLIKHPEVGEEVQKRYRHFLVDEAQDSDRSQNSLLKAFASESTFTVGDLDQAIYFFRGADPSLFLNEAAQATHYDLPNSYRFGFNIAAPANSLIKNNKARIDAAIQAISSERGNVQIVSDAQSKDIVDLLLESMKSVEPGKIAILARRHATLDEVENELSQSRIPYTRLGGYKDITKTAEYRVIKGYLRLAVNRQDRRAFSAIAAAEGLSEERMRLIRQNAAHLGISLYEAYAKDLPQTLSEIRDYLRSAIGEYDPAFRSIDEMCMSESLLTPQEIVQYMALESVQDRMRTVGDTVVLTTCHAAKGLEWDTVFLLGLNSKEFPSLRSVREGLIDEERCVAYVAMTRAMKTLYLVNNTRDEGPSRFLGEMGNIPILKRNLDIWGGDDLVM